MMRAMKVLEQDKRMIGNGCCLIYGGSLLWEGSRSSCLGEAEKHTLTTWKGGMQKTQTQMQWVLR